MIVGNILGIGFCILQNRFHLVSLDAATYYVDAVPVLLSPTWVIVVNIVAFLTSTLALLLPTLVISHIHPARSIRFE